MREQRPLSDLTADQLGYVRFVCTRCPRSGKVKLASLQARFRVDAGLVDILNALAPKDCSGAKRNPWGSHSCGFYYRDLT
jgi:hypothetical protein